MYISFGNQTNNINSTRLTEQRNLYNFLTQSFEFIAVNIERYIKNFSSEIKLCFKWEKYSNFSRYAISLSRHSTSSRIYKRVLKNFEIFVKLNSMIIMVKIVILAFAGYIWRVNRMKVYFHGAKLSYLPFFLETLTAFAA